MIAEMNISIILNELEKLRNTVKGLKKDITEPSLNDPQRCDVFQEFALRKATTVETLLEAAGSLFKVI